MTKPIRGGATSLEYKTLFNRCVTSVISLDSIWDTAFNAAAKSEINKQLAEVERSLRDRVKYVFFHRDTKATENKRDEIRRSFPIHYWNEIRPALEERYTASKMKMSNQIDAMINSVCEEYKRKLDGELLEGKQGMERLEKDKKINKELGNEISSLEKRKKMIDANIQKW